jgi:hypothetical protein
VRRRIGLHHCRRSKWSRCRAHAASASKKSNGGLVKLEDSCIGRWVAFLNAHALLASLVLSGDKVHGPPRLQPTHPCRDGPHAFHLCKGV